MTHQTARPLIGFVQVDVVKRNSYAQAINDLDATFCIFCFTDFSDRSLIKADLHFIKFNRLQFWNIVFNLQRHEFKRHGLLIDRGRRWQTRDPFRSHEVVRQLNRLNSGCLGKFWSGCIGQEVLIEISIGQLNRICNFRYRRRNFERYCRLNADIRLQGFKAVIRVNSRYLCNGRRQQCSADFARQVQSTVVPFDVHDLRTSTERFSRPVTILIHCNIGHPSFQSVNHFGTQVAEFLDRRFLVCEPAVEHLLHRPGGLAKLVQPDHSRAAFERVKGTSQYRQLLAIRWIFRQGFNRLQGSDDHFTGFFQENILQIIFLKLVRSGQTDRQLSDRHRRRKHRGNRHLIENGGKAFSDSRDFLLQRSQQKLIGRQRDQFRLAVRQVKENIVVVQVVSWTHNRNHFRNKRLIIHSRGHFRNKRLIIYSDA